MLDKQKIKVKLEQERDMLVGELKGMGTLDPETNEWEATPETMDYREIGQNDMADRFEDYEAKSSMIKTLEPRLQNILSALKNLRKDSFGRCEVCGKDIELARIEANPAAKTCKKHLNN